MKKLKIKTESGTLGRRSMLKSILAASVTMGVVKTTGIDGVYGSSEVSGVNFSSGMRPVRHRKGPRGPLTIQPVLVYEIPERREGSSWRTWSGLITEEHAEAERNQIRTELEAMKAKVDFSLHLLPLVSVRNAEEAERVAAGSHDGLIVYANGGPMYDSSPYVALMDPGKLNIVFVRYNSGPVYYYYCGAHHRLLRQRTDEIQGIGNLKVEDIVVDDYDEIIWRLRAFNGLKNISGKRIVCIGGPGGYAIGPQASENARLLWDMDIVTVPYEDIHTRIDSMLQNKNLVRRCEEEAHLYLDQPGVELYPMQEKLTTRELYAGLGSGKTLGRMRTFVERAFVLKELYIDLMKENETDAITVRSCMSAFSKSETLPCLTLTLLNDSGYLAFCESDFVVIPASILLHYISGKPVFFGNPTFPNNNMVTVAHCSSPRKMDGNTAEPVKIRTHFESDYGAAPKVEMRINQNLTILIPDFKSLRWAGFEGVVIGNPELDVCTTQIDIRINGDQNHVAREIRGFHWPICYGNYLREVGYALSKSNIDWLNFSV